MRQLRVASVECQGMSPVGVWGVGTCYGRKLPRVSNQTEDIPRREKVSCHRTLNQRPINLSLSVYIYISISLSLCLYLFYCLYKSCHTILALFLFGSHPPLPPLQWHMMIHGAAPR